MMRTLSLLLAPLLLVPAALAGSSSSSPAGAPPAAEGRVIVLGFDGADGRTVQQLMEQGQLPHLARLAEQGIFAPLGTTNPAESPVSWASLNTGRNPSETGIVGFVRKDTVILNGDPMPIVGLTESGVKVPIGELGATPLPAWSGTAMGLALGGGALVVFLLVFGLLLRLKPVPTIALSMVLAGVGFWGGLSVGDYLPPTMPVVKNPIDADAFWEVAGRAGVPGVVLDAAMSWDRPEVEGVDLLSGLGVPDARGDYISYFVYTTDDLYFKRDPKDASTGTGGIKLRVDERDGVIETEVLGPPNHWRVQTLEAQLADVKEKKAATKDYKASAALSELEARLKTELKDAKDDDLTLPMVITKQGDTAEVSIAGQSQTLREGEWSDWYHLTFVMNPMLKVHAITRAKVVSLDEPFFELFLNAIEIDPANPPFWQPISQPVGYSKELASAIGPFETVGWSCLTHPYKDEIIDPVTFMQDIEFTMKWREKLTFDQIARDDWRLFVSCLSTPDRVQHMMYQFYDTEHPLYDAERASQKMTFFGEEIELRDAIPAIYRQVDRIVGRVMDEHMRPGDTLLIGADHGFQTFRRQVHVNNWLQSKGYLVMQEPKKSSSKSKMVSLYVDWDKTKAYSFGLGTVYLNLKGRDKKGCVDPSEADEVMESIRRDFLAAVDPDHPEVKIGSSVEFAKDIHHGPHFDLEADLFLGFAPTYRVSWATASGGISMEKQEDGSYDVGPFVVDNDKMWSGDHVSVDVEHVKGMFFCSRPVQIPEGGVNLMHIAPTVLSLLGVPIPEEMDLPPLELAAS